MLNTIILAMPVHCEVAGEVGSAVRVDLRCAECRFGRFGHDRRQLDSFFRRSRVPLRRDLTQLRSPFRHRLVRGRHADTHATMLGKLERVLAIGACALVG
jgi:hypothetical protein